MKKVILIIVLVLCVCFGIIYFSTDLLKPTETLNSLETSKLVNESYLDILVAMEEYNSVNIRKDYLLEAAMRIARELDLVKNVTEPVYIEYVPKDIIHTIIYELTGIKMNEPIVEEDFYYLYDSEHDYYYIVPLGTDWIHYGKIKSAVKKGNSYTINCTGEASDYNGGADTVFEDMEIVFHKKNNYKYVKYMLESIETSERIDTNSNSNLKVDEYGTSEMNNPLKYYSFVPQNYDRTILLNFAIHGFEDKYDNDGQVLVNTANKLIDYYSKNPESYRNTRVIVIPCSNPDGLLNGTSNNGFGRCNANGIDINRDFDVEYKVITSEKNKTLSPFSAAESRALRDFVLEIDPDVVIDFHGWENCTIGDASIAEIFEEEMNLEHKTEFNSNCSGYFSYWAHNNGAEALLVEFANEEISFDSLISAIDKVI